MRINECLAEASVGNVEENCLLIVWKIEDIAWATCYVQGFLLLLLEVEDSLRSVGRVLNNDRKDSKKFE